jgi:hypothetical protein
VRQWSRHRPTSHAPTKSETNPRSKPSPLVVVAEVVQFAESICGPVCTLRLCWCFRVVTTVVPQAPGIGTSGVSLRASSSRSTGARGAPPTSDRRTVHESVHVHVQKGCETEDFRFAPFAHNPMIFHVFCETCTGLSANPIQVRYRTALRPGNYICTSTYTTFTSAPTAWPCLLVRRVASLCLIPRNSAPLTTR